MIRRLKQKDVGAAVAIIRENLGAEEASRARFYFNLSLKSTKEKSKAGLTRLSYWVALKKKKIVGIAGLYNWLYYPHDLAWLGFFAVKKAEQRKGIGTALYKAIIKARPRLLFAEIASDQLKARRFLTKQGFKKVAVLKDFWEKGIDQYIFEKKLR